MTSSGDGVEIELTEAAARRMLLAAQGLLDPPPEGAQRSDVLAAIRRMAALQIDTIHVVARSPYFVLWSRLGPYQPHWLDELLAEGALFEYWAHAACFLPIEDYGLYRAEMLEGRRRARVWLAEHPDVAAAVLERVTAMGEVRSADFERTDGRGGGWWNWKPEKSALECLYSTGVIMIARRDPNFHRVYARRERVLPGWDDTSALPQEQAHRALAVKAVRALGAPKAAWVPDYFKMPKRGITALLEELAAAGEVIRAGVEGWDEPAYIHPDHLDTARCLLEGRAQPRRTTLLTPFDPVVWDRERALRLFGFDYRIETYTRAEKRRFGYFTLPILHRDALIGRLDAKAHRKEGRFEVRALHLEADVEVTEELFHALAATLRDCAAWHHTPDVEITWSDPPAFAAELTRHSNML